MAVPAFAPVGVEHADHLAHRHRAGIGTQAGKDFGQFRRQQVAGIHRHQLPDFHRRATQLRQLLGDAAGVGWRQQQVVDFRALALRKLPRALGQHIAGDTPGQAAQSCHARPAPAGHRRRFQFARHERLVATLQQPIGRVGFIEMIRIGNIGRAFHHHDDEGGNADGEKSRPVQDDQADHVNVGGQFSGTTLRSAIRSLPGSTGQ